MTPLETLQKKRSEEFDQEFPYIDGTNGFGELDDVKLFLSISMTLAYQAGLARAREMIEEHDPNVKMGREASPAYWGKTLRAALSKESTLPDK